MIVEKDNVTDRSLAKKAASTASEEHMSKKRSLEYALKNIRKGDYNLNYNPAELIKKENGKFGNFEKNEKEAFKFLDEFCDMRKEMKEMNKEDDDDKIYYEEIASEENNMDIETYILRHEEEDIHRQNQNQNNEKRFEKQNLISNEEMLVDTSPVHNIDYSIQPDNPTFRKSKKNQKKRKQVDAERQMIYN